MKNNKFHQLKKIYISLGIVLLIIFEKKTSMTSLEQIIAILTFLAILHKSYLVIKND